MTNKDLARFQLVLTGEETRVVVTYHNDPLAPSIRFVVSKKPPVSYSPKHDIRERTIYLTADDLSELLLQERARRWSKLATPKEQNDD